jgi:hypothetical protein
MSVYDLEIKKIGHEFALCYQDKPIFIAQGKVEVKSKSKSLIEFIHKDFERCAEISIKKDRTIEFNNKFCAYVIFSDQKYLLENPEFNEYQKNMSNLFIKYDTSLIRTANGPPYETMQLEKLMIINDNVEKLIGSENFKKLSGCAWGTYYNVMTEEEDHGVGKAIPDEEFKVSGLTKNITQLYSAFTNEEKGAVHALYMCLNKMSVLMPILLVAKKITLGEYTNSFMGLGENFTYVYENAKNKKEEDERYQELYDICFNSASVVLEYLKNSYQETNEDEKLLSKDESITHELKSTLRMNLLSKQKDDRMLHDVLKTIVGFLNTKGGNLIIGVSDDKKIIGLEEDKFKNLDEWQRYLKDQINHKIGNGFLENFIHPRFIKKDNKDIAIIECDQLPNDKTAFLEDTVYVRQTASTKKLSPKETLEWREIRLSK